MTAPVTQNLTILLTDIEGFTDKTSRKSRSDIQNLLDRHREIVLPILESRQGRLVKTIGDAFLMAYESPTNAVLAGLAVQEALEKYNADKSEDDKIKIRIAINLGEVNIAENDVFGEAVNIAARIESITMPGEVFFTEAVYLAMNKTEVPSSEVGILQLKGVPEKVKVYKVKREHPVGGEESVSSGVKRQIFNIFRTNNVLSETAPKAVSAVSGRRSSIFRRAVALLIDAIICAILVSILFGTRKDEVHITYREKEKNRILESLDKTKSDADIQVNKEGIRVDDGESKVSIGSDGISVKTEYKKKKYKNTGDDVSELKTTESEPDEEVLHEKGPLRVTKTSKKKNIAFPIFWLFYSTLFLGLWSATPGKKILKLAVARMDGLPLTWKEAFIRSLFTLLSGYVLFLGFLWALWEKDRRGWHDLLAGTIVVPKD